MSTRFITIEGIKIAHIEKNAQADKVIFFIHGNSSAYNTWRLQFDSKVLMKYRLIAFDLPSHGFSEQAKDYSLSGIARIIADAVSILAGSSKYILVGFSLGSNILANMLSYNLSPAGIVLAGACTITSFDDLQRVFLPNENSSVLFSDEPDDFKLHKLALDCFYKPEYAILEEYKTNFKRVRPPFRSLLIKNASERVLINENILLNKTNLPILVIFGKDEKIVNPAHMDNHALFFWKNSPIKLDKAGHFVYIEQAEEFNRLLNEYATEQFTTAHSG